MAPAREFILGGQRSGKSRCAEKRALAWLAQPGREAVLLATAQAGDEEMGLRIARHRADRVPGIAVQEVPRELSAAIAQASAPSRLVIVDCLTLWATNLLMPLHCASLDDGAWQVRCDQLCVALAAAPGPVVLVSNEIGLGVSPLSREAAAIG